MTSAAPLTHPRRNPVRKHLLSGGIIRCGLCGKKLAPQPSPSRKAGYACRPGKPTGGCGKIRISAEGVENDVAAHVIARLASPSIRERLLAAASRSDTTGETFEEQLAATRARMDELTDEWTAGTLPREQWVRATQRLTDQERDLEQQIQRAKTLMQVPDGVVADALTQWWETEATLKQKRDLVQLLINHIDVHPATRRGHVGFDSDRVSYIWR